VEERCSCSVPAGEEALAPLPLSGSRFPAARAGWRLRGKHCSVVQQHKRGPVSWVSWGRQIIQYVHGLCRALRLRGAPTHCLESCETSVQTTSMLWAGCIRVSASNFYICRCLGDLPWCCGLGAHQACGSSSPCPAQASSAGREAPSPAASPAGQTLACRAGPMEALTCGFDGVVLGLSS